MGATRKRGKNNLIYHFFQIFISTQNASQNLIDKYRGCTIIDGDLILIQCYGRDFNFSGIQDVQMITGHLYAGQLEVDVFEMKSLRVIRGQRELFNETDPTDQVEAQNWLSRSSEMCRGGCALVIQVRIEEAFC